MNNHYNTHACYTYVKNKFVSFGYGATIFYRSGGNIMVYVRARTGHPGNTTSNTERYTG